MVFYWFLNFFFPLYLWLGTGSGVVIFFGRVALRVFLSLDFLLGFGAYYLSTLFIY